MQMAIALLTNFLKNVNDFNMQHEAFYTSERWRVGYIDGLEAAIKLLKKEEKSNESRCQNSSETVLDSSCSLHRQFPSDSFLTQTPGACPE